MKKQMQRAMKNIKREKNVRRKRGDDRKKGRGEENGLTVAALLEKWLYYNQYSIKESTLANYKWIIRKRLLPVMAKLRVDELNRDKVENIFMRMLSCGSAKGKELSAKSVKDAATVFKAAIHFGADRGICGDLRFKLPMRSIKGEENVLSRTEQLRLEKHIAANPSRSGLGMLLSLYTGIRIGEVCGLQWGDIDASKGEMHIKRTVQRIYDPNGENGRHTRLVIGEPKSERSNRIVPIPDFLMKQLKQFRETANDGDYVITGRTGVCIEPRTYSYRFKTCLRECGIRKISFHTLRHTFATRCIESGCDARTLSELMGHSNVSTTLKIYVHSSMTHKKTAVERMRQIFRECTERIYNAVWKSTKLSLSY